MEMRMRLVANAMAVAAVAVLVTACSETESTTIPGTTTASSSVPTYAEISRAVTLDDADAAVIKGALAQWNQTVRKDDRDTPFGSRRAQMQFVADVASALDNAQLSQLVDFLVARNQARREETGGSFVGRRGDERHVQQMADALGLSTEQQKAVKSLHEELRADAKKQFEAFHAGSVTREQLHETLKSLHEARRDKLAGILTAEQLTKLDAMHEERMDGRIDRRLERVGEHIDEHAAWLDDLLGLTDEQLAQVTAALTVFSNQAKNSLEALKNDSITRDQLHDRMKDAHDALATSLEKILTDEQWARLEIVRPLLFRPDHA